MSIYLYAITAGERPREVGELGLPDGRTEVVGLCRNNLTAIVSKYQGPAFGELPKAVLLRYLAVHQQVIEHAASDRPVLPVKFGTILNSASEVCAALDRWHRRLAISLGLLGDAVEIEVAATWDLRQVFAEIARRPQIAALAASVVGRPDSETVVTRAQVGKLVKEDLDRLREEYRQQVVRSLLRVTRNAQPNALPSDELVLNVAFLVERARLDDFYACVQRLDRSFQDRLTFRCVGPLPPYTFGTVEITRPRSEAIDAARRLLELGERASEVDVKASYRRLAARWHPDRNPENPLAPERFSALSAAHSQLLDYLHGQRTGEGAGEEARQYDLAPTAVRATLLMAIRRPMSELIPCARAS